MGKKTKKRGALPPSPAVENGHVAGNGSIDAEHKDPAPDSFPRSSELRGMQSRS